MTNVTPTTSMMKVGVWVRSVAAVMTPGPLSRKGAGQREHEDDRQESDSMLRSGTIEFIQHEALWWHGYDSLGVRACLNSSNRSRRSSAPRR